MVAKYGETIPEKILDRIRAEAELYEYIYNFPFTYIKSISIFE